MPCKLPAVAVRRPLESSASTTRLQRLRLDDLTRLVRNHEVPAVEMLQAEAEAAERLLERDLLLHDEIRALAYTFANKAHFQNGVI